MKDIYDITCKFEQEINHWFSQQARNLYGMYYLYHRESTKHVAGDLIIAEDKPEGYILSDNRRVSPAISKLEQIRLYRDTLHCLPILSIEQS